ncbi:MAG: biotin carboxylase N-terminal domain-containing protein [Vampirovibrionales bacterium]|nr:biotin carboxylase N-terminal domain-containing protein [Vampirovibrionales bacterium]
MSAAKISRVLIANRGEIAVRIARSCQQMGLEAVGVFSTHDEQAMHVRQMNRAFPLGGEHIAQTYLNGEQLIDIAKRSDAQAIHPGYGFLSENAAFAQRVLDAGLIWVGPPPSAMAAMGDKAQAKFLMRQAGVPVLPDIVLSPKNLPDEASLKKRVQEEIGYPLLVKATGGGGGKGMRRVDREDQLLESLHHVISEAEAAFGHGNVLLERYLPTARHVEVQILGDQNGHIVHLYERECSLQRRHQKIIEESPCVALESATRQKMLDAAVAAAKAVEYTNAGTVEFLWDQASDAFYFLEMNTRLQVEHPVTEWRTGLDLVALQIQIAQGEPLPFTQADIHASGHAIECRLYAENPALGFLPATGVLSVFDVPQAPFIRLDSGVEAGDSVSVYYDPQLAKLSVLAPTRQMALSRMVWALERTAILGVETNATFLRKLLQHPQVSRDQTHTQWLTPERIAQIIQFSEPTEPPPTSALLAVASVAQWQTALKTPRPVEEPLDRDPYSPWNSRP